MTRTALFLACLALASPAAAQHPAHCRDLGDVALRVMQARQLGVPEADMMSAARDGAAAAELTWIVREAYEEPVLASTDDQTRIMAQFAVQIEQACRAG